MWVMVPAGPPTEEVLAALAERMEPGDILIDGGNSYYKDDVRRARQMKAKGIQYLDVGTSGGVWGLERGYCLMIGGSQDAVAYLDPIFRALAPGRGHGCADPSPRAFNGHCRTRVSALRTLRAPAISSRWCTTASSTA